MGSGAGFGGDLKFPADELLSSREDVDDARGEDDFAGFNSDEGNQSERDGFVKVAEEDGEPCDSAGEDDGVRGEDGEECGWEFLCHSPVREESGEECGGEKANEEAGGGSGEVCGSGGGSGEDGDSGGALGEVEDDGGDGGFASGERGEDEEGEGLEGCGDGEVGDLDFGGERQRQRANDGEDDGAEECGRGLGEGLGGLHGGGWGEVGGLGFQGWRILPDYGANGKNQRSQGLNILSPRTPWKWRMFRVASTSPRARAVAAITESARSIFFSRVSASHVLATATSIGRMRPA